MLKKFIKPLVITGALSAVLVGCSQDNEMAPGDGSETQGKVAQGSSKEEGFNTASYYKLKDSDVLVEVNGDKLTVGELKEKAFNQLLVTEVNQFIERQLLMEKYPVSEKELKTELEKFGATAGIDKEQIKYQLSYDKAVREGVKITDTDLKKIYNENFKDSGRTYAEMKSELKQMAPYYKNNQVFEKLSEIRKDEDAKFLDKKLEKQVNAIFVAPYQNQQSEKN